MDGKGAGGIKPPSVSSAPKASPPISPISQGSAAPNAIPPKEILSKSIFAVEFEA
jgi:hypothetical protein